MTYLAIVETSDAVLVVQKDQVQDVKKIVEALKSNGRSEHIHHREVYRPWGKYDSIDHGDRYQVKRITVKPGAKLSVQMHHHRAEHWIVVSGTAKGKTGIVTGHHGGAEHVIMDFDDATLKKLTYDDKIIIESFGVGLEIEDFKTVKIFYLAPELLKKMKVKKGGRKLEVPVVTKIPAFLMGSGLGDSSPFKGDYDIQTSDSEASRKYGVDKLRVGDVVAVLEGRRPTLLFRRKNANQALVGPTGPEFHLELAFVVRVRDLHRHHPVGRSTAV